MSTASDLAIRELLHSGAGREAVDAFIEAHDFPIREGPHTTFVYRGEATSVLVGHWLFGTAAAREMERVPGSDLWFLTLDLPAESRVEYRFQRVRGADAEWILDPLNERTVRDPFGVWSVCHGEGYERPGWTEEDPQVNRGELSFTDVRSRALGTRRVSVYTPFGFRNRRRYPLLVVLDGENYLEHAGCRTVLDNLIHRREIPPLIAAFVTPDKRIREYADNPAHAEFLTSDLVSHLQTEFPIRLRPDDRGLVGAGLGAVAALTAAWRYPGFFGKLLLSLGIVHLHGCRPEHAHGVARPGRGLRERLSGGPAPGEQPRVRELRNLRAAHLREPVARSAAPGERHGGPLRRGGRRPQLGQLAGPVAGGPLVALPGAAVALLPMSRGAPGAPGAPGTSPGGALQTGIATRERRETVPRHPPRRQTDSRAEP